MRARLHTGGDSRATQTKPLAGAGIETATRRQIAPFERITVLDAWPHTSVRHLE
jgi:hypothetical protein